jgi:histidine triad (HIT) family protein
VSESCIFCRIASGEIPAKKVLETDEVVAFHDLAPQAPVHVLVIPKRHLGSLRDAAADAVPLLGRLQLAACEVARECGIAESGFRVVTNTGADAGQSVFHLHLHVLGGRHLAWPPG